jgi:two-component system cell cycle response regulator DivK
VASPSILLIDADDDSRIMYAEYLRSRGMTVVVAEATDDALLKSAGSFDGIELVRRIRVSHRTARSPIIVLTACAFEPDQQRALAAGCDRFLPKPCLPEQLEDEIRKLLALHHLPDAEPAKVHASPKRRKRRAS